MLTPGPGERPRRPGPRPTWSQRRIVRDDPLARERALVAVSPVVSCGVLRPALRKDDPITMSGLALRRCLLRRVVADPLR